MPVSALDCDNGTMNVREKVKVRFDLLLRGLLLRGLDGAGTRTHP